MTQDVRSEVRPSWWSDGQFADVVPTLFQKVLLTTDGTVTELLSLYTGRAIAAQKIDQSLGRVAAPALLSCAADEPLLHRSVVLTPAGGGDSVFAESFFVFSLFSKAVQRELLEANTPIGLLWRADRLEMFREVLERKVERNPRVAELLGVPGSTALFSRTYAIFNGRRGLGLLTEKFAQTAYR